MGLREAIHRTNLLPFGIFPKGGGACLNPNVSRNFFVLFMFGHFFRKGVALFQTFGGTFLLEFGHFSVRAPDSKDDEELFSALV